MGCSGSKATAGASDPQPDTQATQNHDPQQDTQDTQNHDANNEEEVYVTVEEAKTYVQTQLKVSEQRAEKIVDRFNKNDDGKISNNELAKLWQQMEATVTRIRALFSELDQDGSGYVGLEEGSAAIKDTFPDHTQDQLKKLLGRFDTNKTGKLSYNEFVYFYSFLSMRKEHLLEQLNEQMEGKDQSESVDAEQVVAILCREGALEEEEAKSLVEDFDINKDGKLKKGELQALLNKLFN